MKENHKNKFVYKKGDLKITKKLSEGLMSFTKFLSKKRIDFDERTMRWITIHDESGKRQHILISKEDGTILAGLGGSRNGEKIKNVFKDFDEEKHKGFDISKALTGEAIHYECSLEENVELTTEERKNIAEYSVNMYQDVNECLRNYDSIMNSKKVKPGTDPLVGFAGYTASELVKYADVISGALKKHRTKKPMITYRGVNRNYIEQIQKDLEVGNKLYDYGFASTSSDFKVAEHFCKDGYIMEIHIPEGSRAASIDSLSKFSGVEKEVLIDKEACFLIKEINHKTYTIVVELSHDE